MQDLLNFLKYTRQRTVDLLKFVKDVDFFANFVSSDKTMNNLAWQVGHIAVSENFLLNRALGMPGQKIEWARDFGLGSVNADPKTSPSKENIILTFHEVHDQTLINLSSFDETKLDTEIELEFKPYGFDRKLTHREIVMHGIGMNHFIQDKWLT